MIESQYAARSTTEPPREVTRELLRAFNGLAGALPPALQPLRDWFDQGQVPDLRPAQPPTQNPTPDQQAEWSRLTGRSPEVILLLAAAPFLRAGVEAQPWSAAAGIAECAVDLVDLHSKRWGAISAAAYEASVNAVHGGMDAAIVPRARAEGRFPFLLFALALRMHESVDRFSNTARVIDIATGWVSTVVHQLKHRQQVPRAYEAPFDRFPAPLVSAPGFTAFPGGHAALGHALAELLGDLTNAEPAARLKLRALAAGLAATRERAGLHCGLDTERGRELGLALAGWMTDPATLADPGFAAWSALFAHAREEWK